MKIFVIKDTLFLGTLEENTNSIIFTYSDEVNKNMYIQGLSEKINTSKELFPVFENMLPENEQLKLLKSKKHISSQIEILLYLTNIHGTYEFYNEKDFLVQSKARKQKDEKPFIFEDKKAEILDNDYIFPNILDDYSLDIKNSILHPDGLMNNTTGLSGIQYKLSITKDDINKTIKEGDGSKNSSYLMKPYNKHNVIFNYKDKDRLYTPCLLINEHIFMTLARDFGFDIPYNAIIKGETDYHYIIKRFDRFEESKIEHYEILTLMNKMSKDKYNVSMKEALLEAKKYLDKKNILNLYKFIIFSIVIGHGDLHAKNISLIYASNYLEEKRMLVSPFYDIATTKIYKDMKANDIGLKIGNKKSNLKKKDLLELANFIDIQDETANKIIELLAVKFIKTFESYIIALPNNIKSLPFILNRYQYQKPFEVALKEYYKKRSDYINKQILNISHKNDKDDISIWD